jgi:glutaredoxin 3
MEYLSQKGVPFTEKNVSRDQSAVQDLMKMKARSLPVIVIGDKLLNGFGVEATETFVPNDNDRQRAHAHTHELLHGTLIT